MSSPISTSSSSSEGPVTLSNFNNIDFSAVVTALMQQASIPLTDLQSQQTDLQTESTEYGTLATDLAALQSAAVNLTDPTNVNASTVSSTDASAVSGTVSSSAVPGQYTIVVTQLATAQVTESNTTAPDADTTVVASGGTLTIGGVAVAVTGPVTLSGLASDINGTTNIGVTASVVQTAPGAYSLVLTGNETGATNSFTIQNALTGGSGVGFKDTNGDGNSGENPADNATQATNAALTINNVSITSASNTLTSGVPGVTVNLLQQDPSNPVVLAVSEDSSGLASQVNQFVTAYNNLVSFASGQVSSAAQGTTGTLAYDPVLRGVGTDLIAALSGSYGSGNLTQLGDIGLGFNQDGTISLDQSMLTSAIQSDPTGVTSLLAGDGDGATGAFGAINTLLTNYTQAGGFLPSAQTGLTQEQQQLDTQISDMQARLALQQSALQAQFTAADQAIATLNSQSNSLTSIVSNYSTNSVQL